MSQLHDMLCLRPSWVLVLSAVVDSICFVNTSFKCDLRSIGMYLSIIHIRLSLTYTHMETYLHTHLYIYTYIVNINVFEDPP